jgi:hypothetical protein
MITSKILADNLKFNKTICEKFEFIVSKITQTAESAHETIELLKYIDYIRYTELFKLENLLNTAASNLLFAIDYAFLTKDDFKWNSYTFGWLNNLNPLLNSTENQLSKERDIWVVRMSERRQKLQARINAVYSKVEEFKGKERISDYEVNCEELRSIAAEINEIIKEVRKFFL